MQDSDSAGAAIAFQGLGAGEVLGHEVGQHLSECLQHSQASCAEQLSTSVCAIFNPSNQHSHTPARRSKCTSPLLMQVEEPQKKSGSPMRIGDEIVHHTKLYILHQLTSTTPSRQLQSSQEVNLQLDHPRKFRGTV